MAEHHDTAPAELGAPMDYKEHENTYNLFLTLSKWGVIFCVALLAAMAFGFFKRKEPEFRPAPQERTHDVAGRLLPLRIVENDRARRLTLRIDAGGPGLRVPVPRRPDPVAQVRGGRTAGGAPALAGVRHAPARIPHGQARGRR